MNNMKKQAKQAKRDMNKQSKIEQRLTKRSYEAEAYSNQMKSEFGEDSNEYNDAEFEAELTDWKLERQVGTAIETKDAYIMLTG